MGGERIVFCKKLSQDTACELWRNGAIDKELIDAVEVFLELQKRRLGLIKKSKDKLA